MKSILRAVSGLLGLAGLGGLAARAESMHVVVGARESVVTVERTVTATNREQEFVLDPVPPEADLGSLTVRARVPLSGMEWGRAVPAEAGAAPLRDPDGTLRWRPLPGPAPAPGARGAVRCRLQFPEIGPHHLQWTFLTPNLAWRAGYQVLVRGDFDAEQEPLSVDVQGLAMISNGTSQLLGPCLVSVSGTGDARPEPDQEPGFLMFGGPDNPLVAMQDAPVAARGLEHLYRLPGEHVLLPRRDNGITFFSASRRPVERIYRMGPEGGDGQVHPLRKYILFRNRTPDGPGPDLPAGRARIYLGSLRSTVSQAAWFEHTPANGEIFIDLGPSDRLRSVRSTVLRTSTEDSAYQESYEIRVSSDLDGTASIDVEERPVSTLSWEVVRANRGWERSGQSLRFRTTVDGHGETVITYTLRIKQPET